MESAIDIKFSWAPSGKAIYFERTFRGAKNLWKMTVDPGTSQATAIERLTTGPGLDTHLAISAMEGNWPLLGQLNISGLGSFHSMPAAVG